MVTSVFAGTVAFAGAAAAATGDAISDRTDAKEPLGRVPDPGTAPAAPSRSTRPMREAPRPASLDVSAGPSTADLQEPDFSSSTFLDGINQPMAMTFLPDGRMLVLEKPGVVEITDPEDGTKTTQTYLDISEQVDDGRERGLIDITLDPNFEENGYVYLFYSNSDDEKNRIARFTHQENGGGLQSTADESSEFLVWEETTEIDSCCHQGAGLDFGPEGKLWATMGDDFHGGDVSQDLSRSGGKVIRVNKDGTIPSDNPYANDGNPDTLGEIWADGVRNPFRAEWDLQSGRFFFGDVGGNSAPDYEEVNVATLEDGGVDYGWPYCEGTSKSNEDEPCDVQQKAPVYAYPHSEGNSITGGEVYRGQQFPEQYRGAYFFGDYAKDWIKYMTFDSNGDVENVATFADDANNVVHITTGPDGSLYWASISDGTIHRVDYTGNEAPTIDSASATPTEASSAPQTVDFSVSASDPEGDSLTYDWSFGDGSTGSGASPSHTYQSAGTYTAYVEVSDGTHTIESRPIEITIGEAPTVTIESPADGSLFQAGDTIQFSATASDPQDGQLGDDAFTWDVAFDHDPQEGADHDHPVLSNYQGASGSFDVPTSGHGYMSDTSYTLTVTATDSDGLSASDSVTVEPDKVEVTFDTAPEGLDLTVDGLPVNDGTVYDTLIGFQHSVSASQTQCLDGREYEFQSWSDGGSQTHDYTVPDSDATLTATYQDVGACESPVVDGLVAQFEADQGLSTSDDQVTGWSDQSGTGLDLSAAGDPTVSTAPSGAPAVSLDGDGDKLVRTDDLTGLPSGDQDRTMVVVTKYDGADAYAGTAFGTGEGNEAFGLVVDGGGMLTVQGWGGSNDLVSDTQGTGAGWMVQSVTVSGDQVTHYKDGTQVDSGTQSYATDLNDDGSKFVIGEEIDEIGYGDMEIAAAYVYDRALSDTERQQVRQHLQEKYLDEDTEPANEPPTAAFHYHDPVAGQPATYHSESTDSDGQITQYEWDFDGDGTFEETTTSVDIEHTFESAGEYDVTLRVTDDDGATDTVTETVSVAEQGGGDGDVTVAEAVASHGDGDDSKISQLEILTAIDWWQNSAEVPNTGGETISLAQMLDLIDLWQNDGTVGDEPQPAVDITSPQEGETITGDSVTVSWESSNMGADDHVHVYLDGADRQGSQPQDGSYTYTGVEPGTHTATVVAATFDHQEYQNAEATETVTFSVESADGGNQAPTAADDAVTVDAGESTTIDVLANDEDPDGSLDPSTVTIDSGPSSGTATVNADGSVTYEHDGSDTTSDSFVYTVTDGEGAGDAATVSITIDQGTGGDASLPVQDGLVTHFAADQGVSAGTGDVVTGWADQSGQGNDLTASGDPMVKHDTLAGKPVVSFDGDGDALVRSGDLGGLPAGSSDRTVMYLVNYQSSPSWGGGLAYGATTCNAAFGTIVHDGSLQVQGWCEDFTSDASADVGPDGWMVQSAVVSSNQVTHYKDGSQIDQYTHEYATDPQKLVIGAELDEDPSVDMEVAEAVVFDRALSDAERQQVRDYLQQKYFDDGGGTTNEAPTAADDSASAAPGESTTVDVLANDEDSDGSLDASSVSVTSQPPTGSVAVDSSTGEITYTAPDDASGQVSFAYSVADDDGATDTATVTVTVNAPTDSSLPVTAGLVTHLEADQGVATDGDTVTGWTDQSSAGIDLSASGDPTLVQDGLNGQPVVSLDGGSDGDGDKLVRTGDLTGLPSGDQDRTMVVVTKYDSTDAWVGTAFGNGDDNQAFGLVVRDGSGALTLQGWGNDEVSETQGVGAGWMVQSAVVENDQFVHYKDGTQIDSGTHSFDTTLTADGSKFVVGEEIAEAGYADMDVAAVLVYDRALSDTERQQVQDHLQQKYFGTDGDTTNEAPTASDNSASVTAGESTTVDVLANDEDPDGNLDASSVSIVDQPSTGTVSVDSSTGEITYDAPDDASGTVTFTYTVADDDGATSDAATVTVTVNAPTDSSLPVTAGLVTHLEADQGVATDGDTVTGWTDQSSTGLDLSAAGDPTLVQDGLNGQPVVSLDGDGDKLVRTGDLSGLPSGAQDRTMVVVTKYDDANDWAGTAFGNGDSNQAFGLVVEGGSGALTVQGWGNDLVSGTQGTDAGWMVQSATVADDHVTHYKDGTQIGSGDKTYETTLEADSSKFVIGEEIAENGYNDMEIAAVVVYDRALSDTERQQVRQYLQDKYDTGSSTEESSQ
jgi:glucose/arabinose dehydrogenase/uncharacterized beta-barrel protein YwiB (DUF1934 family)